MKRMSNIQLFRHLIANFTEIFYYEIRTFIPALSLVIVVNIRRLFFPAEGRGSTFLVGFVVVAEALD
jgi:hypothetical protein